MTALEDAVSRTNEFYFLREFTFPAVTFAPTSRSELELADGIIWLDDLAVVFQMKERDGTADRSKQARDKWFESKVIGRATKQIRDTINYLHKHGPISATNNYGQTVLLSQRQLKTLHKVVLFKEPATAEPPRRPKYHKSRTVGLVHLLPLDDYVGIVRSLLTLSEISEYLEWREMLNSSWPSEAEALPEQSLVGHYLRGEKDAKPSLSDVVNLRVLQDDIHAWDMTGILTKFLERTMDDIGGIKYHLIIQEVAKLHRGELRLFKERFVACMEAAKASEFRQPYRFTSPRTHCGFVFIPLQSELREVRRTALANLTAANKYDQRLDKCIGLSFVRDDDGWFTVDWCAHATKWEFDEEMESRLAKSYPFRPVKEQIVYRYPFKTDGGEI